MDVGRSGVVLEVRKGLQRIFGGAGEHHLLVPHLERAERHDDVFRAHAQEAADRQDREGHLLVGGNDQIVNRPHGLVGLVDDGAAHHLGCPIAGGELCRVDFHQCHGLRRALRTCWAAQCRREDGGTRQKCDRTCHGGSFQLIDHAQRKPSAGVDSAPGVPTWHYFLSASFKPPTAFWILPSTLSLLPSVVSLASPVAFPTPSLTAPLACLAEPMIRSLSMSLSLHLLMPARAMPRG